MKAVRIVALLALPLSGVFAAAPAAAQYYGRGYTPPPEEPPYVQFMSGRCRDLYNALRARTLPSSHEVVEGMRREYRRDCEEEEQDARQRYYDQRNDARRAKYDDRRDARRQADVQYKERRADMLASRQEAEIGRQLTAEQSAQCAESYRILAAKKARTDLSVGELNDLRRFEDNVAARCRR